MAVNRFYPNCPRWDQPIQSRGVFLLLHGLGETPAHFEYLANWLLQNNYSVSTPLLPGHGEPLEDQHLVEPGEWEIAVNDTIAKIAERCPDQPLHIVGSGLGGNLAWLSLSESLPASLTLIATPITNGFIQQKLSSVTSSQTLDQRTNLLPFALDVASRRERLKRRDRAHTHVPTSWVRYWEFLIGKCRNVKVTQTVPVLLVQSIQDHVVDPEDAERWKQLFTERHPHLSSQILWLRRPHHHIAIDFGRRHLAERIQEFVTSVHNSPSTAPTQA